MALLRPTPLRDISSVSGSDATRTRGWNQRPPPLSVIRPFCVPADYAEVLFLTNRIVAEEITKAGLTPPSLPALVK